MQFWNRFLLRLRSLVHKDELDDQLSSELEFHLAEQKAELIAAGMSEMEAEREARRLFGPVTSLREACRDTRGTQWLEDFLFDTRHTFRSLGRALGFSIVAILTLALGIGVNVAFFSIAYGILIRPLPYPNPEQLILAPSGSSGTVAVTRLRQFSRVADYAGYGSGSEYNIPLFIKYPMTRSASRDYDHPMQSAKIRGAPTTYNLARVLGVQPIMGRWFVEEDELSDRIAVVISHRTWRDRFDLDPTIIGQSLNINNDGFKIVGVMPPGFAFPTPQTEFWLPMRIDPAKRLDLWGGAKVLPIGRLHPGFTIASAETEISEIWGKNSVVIRLDEWLFKQVRPKLIAISVASLLLLLIACGNVGNLLLARSLQREREFAMREALGAIPGRLIRQSVTENFLLVLIGGFAGLITAMAIFESSPLIFPSDMPRMGELLEVPTLAYGASFTLLLTFVLFTVAPLLRSPLQRVSLAGRALTSTVQASHAALLLIGVEVAFATTLLIGAGLMGRTLWQLATFDAGTNAGNVAVVRFLGGGWRCQNSDPCAKQFEAIHATLLASPPLRNISWANHAPLDQDFSSTAFTIEDPVKAPVVLWQTNVTPGYFKLLQVPLRAGRYFTDADQAGAPPVTILSESTARRYWPNQNPIGRRIQPVSGKDWLTVVGVVGDVAQFSLSGLPEGVDGVHYRPLSQTWSSLSQPVRLTALAEWIGTDDTWFSYLKFRYSGFVMPRIQRIAQIRWESVADQRSTATLLALLAALGLTLGIAGVYGVISHRAAQRTQELSIRLALGATPLQLVLMVMKETILVTLAGSAVGVVCAYVLSRYLESFIFGITTHDLLAFTVSPLVLLLAATIAAVVPALRVMRTDPASTLRHD